MGRTHLTTPPGDPVRDDRARDDGEHWSSSFASPVEPSWPGRFRRLWIGLALLTIVALVAWGFISLNVRNNSFDPTSEFLDTETPFELPSEQPST